jgi:hypothetical protein
MREQLAGDEHAAATSARVLALTAAWQAGQIDTPDMTKGTAIAIYAGKLLASRYADVLVSTASNRPPVGVRPSDDHVERLDAAVKAIVEGDPEPAPRLDRLARAEVLESHTASTLAALREQGFPEWERVVGEDPCEKCEPLAGEVQPVGTPFRDHPGCQCGVRPHGEPTPVQEPLLEPIRPLIRFTKIVA